MAGLLKNVLLFRKSNVRYLHVTSMMQKLTQFILSDIGEGIREVNVKEWFVKVGDKVSQFDDICLVESDKASVNITSRYDGIIKHLHYQVGDTALVGKPLVDIDTAEGEVDAAQSNLNVPPTSLAQAELTKTKSEERTQMELLGDNFGNKKLATPAVRRIAMEHNIPLKEVPGTGKDGRVMKEDILNYINQPTKEPKKTVFVEQEKIIPIVGIKKVMAKTMTESSKIPTFGYYDEINITKLVELRNDIKVFAKESGKRITFLPFFIQALSKCIHMYPEINSSIDENCANMIIKNYHNVGIAVDTPKGLVVPNIKNVQNLTFGEINAQLNLLLDKGRNGKLMPEDMMKGTISISNIGAIGGTYAVPLINPPEVCILAIGKIRVCPLFNEEDKIIKSYICSLSWTADHRIIDGATMARFSNKFKEYIEKPHLLIFDV